MSTTLSTAIDGFVRTGGPNSFHSAKGDVDVSLLKRTAQEQGKTLLGFFSYRRETTLLPSLRERSVYRSLTDAVRSGELSCATADPPLLVMLSTYQAPAASTVSHKYRMVQAVSAVSRRLGPVSLTVANLSHGADGAHEYEEFVPSSAARGAAATVSTPASADTGTLPVGTGTGTSAIAAAAAHTAKTKSSLTDSAFDRIMARFT